MARRSRSLLTASALSLAVLPLLFPSGIAVSVCLQDRSLQVHAVGENPCPPEHHVAGTEMAPATCCRCPAPGEDSREGGSAPAGGPCDCCVELASFGDQPTTIQEPARVPDAPQAVTPALPAGIAPVTGPGVLRPRRRSEVIAPPGSAFTTPLLI